MATLRRAAAPTRSSAEQRNCKPLTYFLRRGDGDFVAFCLSKPEDAEAFAMQVRRRMGGPYPLPHLYGHFGLVRLSQLGHNGPWVKA